MGSYCDCHSASSCLHTFCFPYESSIDGQASELLGPPVPLRNLLGHSCYELIPNAVADGGLQDNRDLYRALLLLLPGRFDNKSSSCRRSHRPLGISCPVPLRTCFHAHCIPPYEQGKQGRTRRRLMKNFQSFFLILREAFFV